MAANSAPSAIAHFARAVPSRPLATETTENLPGAAAMTCAHDRPIEPVAPRIDKRLRADWSRAHAMNEA